MACQYWKRDQWQGIYSDRQEIDVSNLFISFTLWLSLTVTINSQNLHVCNCICSHAWSSICLFVCVHACRCFHVFSFECFCDEIIRDIYICVFLCLVVSVFVGVLPVCISSHGYNCASCTWCLCMLPPALLTMHEPMQMHLHARKSTHLCVYVYWNLCADRQFIINSDF